MAVAWRVVAQRQFTDVLIDGRIGEVMEITAATGAGTTFSVKIPLDNYTEDAVRSLLETRAEEIARVEALASTTEPL